MNEREVRMIEREVYCDDGNIFLNKRPTWCAWRNTKKKFKKSTPLPSSLDSDDVLKSFSEYFTNEVITITNSFPPTSPAFAVDKTAYSEKLLRTFTPVTEQFVLEILQKTVSRSCGLDPIRTKLLYENLDVPLPTITNIINTPLASGLVQSDFKTAIVKPLLKTPALTKLYWKEKKTTVQSKTCHLCVKPSKRSFYTHSLHTSKKTTSAILSNQPTAPDTAHRDRTPTRCKWFAKRYGQRQILCSALTVQYTAARLILRAPRHQNCTPFLQQLHWLPISERVKYEIVVACVAT